MKKGRKIVANIAKRGSEEEGKFNINFWKDIDGPRKLEVAWEMIEELYLLKGEAHSVKLKMNKSAEKILRRN